MFLNLYFHSKVFFSSHDKRGLCSSAGGTSSLSMLLYHIHPLLISMFIPLQSFLYLSLSFFFLTFFPFISKFIGRTHYYSPISLMAFKATKITSNPLQIKTHSNINKTTEKIPFTNNLILSNVNILPHSLKKSIEN